MRKKFSYFEALGMMLSDAYRVNHALFHDNRSEKTSDRDAQ